MVCEKVKPPPCYVISRLAHANIGIHDTWGRVEESGVIDHHWVGLRFCWEFGSYYDSSVH